MGNEAEQIALVVGVVVAVSLALSQALGGMLTYLTEAIKATGHVPEGYGGIVAMALGILLGMALGGLSDLMAEDSYGMGTMLLLGAFAGALVAANSVKTFKAMGEVNTTPAFAQGRALGAEMSHRTDVATMDDLDRALMQANPLKHPEVAKAVRFVHEVEQQHAQAQDQDPESQQLELERKRLVAELDTYRKAQANPPQAATPRRFSTAQEPEAHNPLASSITVKDAPALKALPDAGEPHAPETGRLIIEPEASGLNTV